MSGHVVLGVCGGIAAYKAVEVLRGFQKAGYDVRCCMTESATHFIGPLTLAAISGHPVSNGRLGAESDAAMAHVEVTRGAALFVVAPATANTIGKLAAGIGDDWLTTHALANEAPMLLAPAMNHRMLAQPSVRANIELLESRGVVIVPAEAGDLACGEVGAGRLADPVVIVAEGLRLIRGARSMEGMSVLVTSGPTFEDIDLVRYVGNRSSGKMGHAIAREAARRGARVVLVTGPVSLQPPGGCEVVRIRSAEQLAAAVRSRLPEADLAFFAAAVADFRPRRLDTKLKREGQDKLVVEMERTEDVLAESVASRPRALLVGFAAEVGELWLDAARDKARRKGCDLLVGNRVDGEGSAFDGDDCEAVVLGRQDQETSLPRASKLVQAGRILDHSLEALAAREGRR
jgi:phosphopantothenoylcysteine decarboxylase/phosphopantothenate--cysteine ligase